MTSPYIRPREDLKNSELNPLTVTHDFTLLYVLCTILNIFPLIPILDNLYHSLHLLMESKAVWKSIKTQYNLSYYLVFVK